MSVSITGTRNLRARHNMLGYILDFDDYGVCIECTAQTHDMGAVRLAQELERLNLPRCTPSNAAAWQLTANRLPPDPTIQTALLVAGREGWVLCGKQWLLSFIVPTA